MKAWSLVALVVVACHEPPPSMPGGQPRPAPAPVPTPTTAASAPPSVVVPVPPAPPAPPAPSPPGPSLPAECIGADFDLDAMFASAAPGDPLSSPHPCVTGIETGFEGSAEAISIDIQLAPPAVAPGAKAKLRATFKNVTSTRRTLRFVRPCSDSLLPVVPFDAAGERADLAGSDGLCLTGCALVAIAIALEPGGVARASGEFVARRFKLASCEMRPVGVLKPGTYQLEVTTPLQFAEVPGGRVGADRKLTVPIQIGNKVVP